IPGRGVMKQEHVKDRLHQAMHRSARVSEEELAEVTAIVLAIVGEVTAELALVIGELAARVEALENKRE
ncbi:MAG: hypothetical protein M3256_20800, partial [Actinomycetota bacterium]|nr:hypothetical protein [Actinomycetota bacterium]